MGWMPPPDGIEVCQAGDVAWPVTTEKASMEKATIIGIDLAKRVLQVHAAAKDGRPVLRKKVSRAQLLDFLAKQPPAVVAMEACARRTIGDGPSVVSGTTCGWFHRFTSGRLCAGRRTTPPTPRRSSRRPRGQRCALWR